MRQWMLSLLLAMPALAQPATSPPPSGLYESWSPMSLAPAGPLATASTLLPQWLSVTTQDAQSVVTFEPDRRVVWRVTWGPHGIVEKVTEVDGQPFSRSEFRYDANGHLAQKIVSGAGIARGPWTFDYRTDRAGRIVLRTAHLPNRRAEGSPNPAYPDFDERVELTYAAPGVTMTTQESSTVGRVDRFDTSGRRLATRWNRHAELFYVRDARTGALLRIDRIRGGARSPASSAHDTTISEGDLLTLLRPSAPFERWEARLLFGAPVNESRDGRGADTRYTDSWADRCWLNQISSIHFDATGLVISEASGCVCGACVDAALTTEAREVIGEDLHRTRGPWVRLDDAVDVTADHRVMTPSGPRPAGELRVGDEIVHADGSVRPLQSVLRLSESRERLGRNLRTASGTFSAGGILFESEQPRLCP